MNGETHENPGRRPPGEGQTSDWKAAMKSNPNGPRFHPADLQSDPKAAHDALLHWDEQGEEILRLLAEHPEHRGRLETLQRADRWLRQRAVQSIVERTQDGVHGPGPDLLTCPPADELYDYGRGPGSQILAPEREAAIDRHLATCLQCEQFVATLGNAPPVPLLMGLPGAELDAPAETFTPAPIRAFPRRRVAVALAAAAGLVLAVGIWRSWSPTTSRAAWPEAPLLRGEIADALIHPRGKVLERTPELAGLSTAFAGPLVFEVQPATAASGYRLQLFRTEGGAFDVPTPVSEWTPTTAESPAPRELGAGHYTWKAWTRVHGLDDELGSRDFEVVTDDALTRELADILAPGTPDAGVRGVALLDQRAYRSDARALARTLPQSPERDEYLGRAPGR